MKSLPSPVRQIFVGLFVTALPAVIFGWTSPQVLNTSTTSDVRFDSSLSIASNGSGTCLAAWCSNTTTGVDFDVRLSRSTNNGVTWSAPTVINTKTPGSTSLEDAAVVAPGTAGTWLAAWGSEDTISGSIGDDYDILFSRSIDNGVTWAPATALNTNAAGDLYSDSNPCLASDTSGTIIAAWEAYKLVFPNSQEGFGDIRFARSTNNGTSWTSPIALSTSGSTDVRFDENVSVATDKVGRWIAVWQSAHQVGDGYGSDWDLFYSRSTDNGSNWSALAPLNTNAATDSGNDMNPRVATDGLGNWIAVWASDDSLGGTIGSDDDILFSRSINNGATWSAPAALNNNAASDTGNDSAPFIIYSGGKFVVVWNSTDRLGGSYPVDSDIMTASSTNGGATWTSPALLNTNATTDSIEDVGPVIAGDNAGNLTVGWRTHIAADRSDGDMLHAEQTASAAVSAWVLY